MKTNKIVYLALHFFAGGPQRYTEDLVLSIYVIYRMPFDNALSCSKKFSDDI